MLSVGIVIPVLLEGSSIGEVTISRCLDVVIYDGEIVEFPRDESVVLAVLLTRSHSSNEKRGEVALVNFSHLRKKPLFLLIF